MKPLKIYTGCDQRDLAALEVCVLSLRHHCSVPIEVIVLKDWELRRAGIYHRSYYVNEEGICIDDQDGRPFSTSFSFLRFAIPLIDKSDDWVIWVDPDFLFRDDIWKLLLRVSGSDKSLFCVHHSHAPPEQTKFGGGAKQQHYYRKNWSSLMVLRPKSCSEAPFTKRHLNQEHGSYLHGLMWLPDEKIGELPEEWNWLAGWSSPDINPKAVHFTRGTPDIPGHEDEPFAGEWAAFAKARPSGYSTFFSNR